ncbi:hypothetical protein CLU79DRAFT_840890 [Phycomyces nitens]|nr:hypothetical protein CLU79DRAFT_840890 [Phycomyces nitens]
MSLQAHLTALDSQLAALQISDNTKPAEGGVDPAPMVADIIPLSSFNEACLPPRKRASYRFLSFEKPASLNSSTKL